MSTTKVKENVLNVTLTTSSVKKAVKSCMMSKRYINTMLRASVINIIYHRFNVDEKEFLTKNFNNVQFKTFRSKSNNVLIREFHTYMTACKDAIEKNYLRDFYLYFVDVASGDITENYKFTFQYADKNEPHQDQSEDNLTESTSELLRTLKELGKHKKFCSETQLKVEFTYFDDTPEEYEPPGFRNVNESESLMRKLTKSGNSVIIGTLFTGFHMMKCRGRGPVFNFEQSSIRSSEDMELTNDGNENNVEDEIRVENEPQENFEEPNVESPFNEIMTYDLGDSEQFNVPNRTSPILQNIVASKINESYMSQTSPCIDISSDEEIEINCPCEIPVLESCTIDQILCYMCKRKYHTPCQGYLDNSFVRMSFRCSYCRGDDDSVITHVDNSLSKSLYRIRFLLGAMYKYGRVTSELRHCFKDTIKKFGSLKVFVLEGDTIKSVNVEVLATFFKFDFKMPDVTKFKSI